MKTFPLPVLRPEQYGRRGFAYLDACDNDVPRELQESESMADAPLLNLHGHAVHGLWQPPRSGGPIFVLLHGGGLDHSAWMPPSRWLVEQGFGFMAADLPGHGRSAGTALSSVPAMARWVLDMLEALSHLADGAPCILAGHSMGSMIALECAAADARASVGGQSRIAGAALLGTVFPLAVSPALLEMTQDDEPGARRMINTWSHALPKPGEGEPAASTVAAMADNLDCMERQAAGVLHTDFLACSTYADGLLRAAEMRCPMLLALGEKDRMTPPRGARALASALHQQVPTTTEIIPGAGHNLMGEQPERVAKSLIGFAHRILAPT